MSTAVEEILSTWREAEDLLESLPPVHPDYETVLLEVTRLRQTYEALVAMSNNAAPGMESTIDTIAEARDLIAQVRAKLDSRRGTHETS